MKKPYCSLVFILGCLLLLTTAEAKKKHHGSPGDDDADLATPAPDPHSLAPEAAPKIDPAAAPSLSLGPFIDQHIGKILAPLGDSSFTQTEVIASMQSSYADGMATAVRARKPAYQAAIAVCAALTDAVTDHQGAVTALRGALATRSSEATQPKGGHEAVSRAKDDDAFFLNAQKSNWVDRAGGIQKNINTLYLREREAERQAGPWVAATAAPAAPPAAASAAVAPVLDPILGTWKWNGTVPVDVRPDHSFDGERPGIWFMTTNSEGKRTYEFHGSKSDWVETMALSDDGKMLTGTGNTGNPVWAQRAN